MFYAILDTGYVGADGWLEKAAALIDGGCALLQVRAKRESSAQRARLVEAVLPLTMAAGIPLILNDDLELASQLPEVGLHIGQDDVSPAEARDTLGPDRVLGWSTHSTEQARAAIRVSGLLSYFAVGPVFATQTKPDYVPVGLELVREVAGMNPPIPFFAIGGIDRRNLPQVTAAGARNLVVVSDVLNDSDTRIAVESYRDHLQSLKE